MDKPTLDEKENIPGLIGAKLSKPPGLKPPVYGFSVPQSNTKKAKQPKVKPQKTINTSVRAGDWVCLICNNLNFSFRNECNRCGMQTKKQNYIQSLMLIGDQKLENKQVGERAPLKDLTNQMPNPNDTNPHKGREVLSKKNSIDEQMSNYNNIPMEPMMNIPPMESGKSDFDFSSNYGFVNAILLTPPRVKSQQVVNRFDFTDSNQKDFPPYKSPKELPSVSPILRKVVSSEMNSKVEPNLKLVNNKLIFEEPAESVQIRKTISATYESTTDYFNLDEINRFITESFKNESCEEKSEDSCGSDEHEHNENPIHSTNENVNPNLANMGMTNANPYQYAKMGFHHANSMEDMRNKKNKKEKKSDWICPRCSNLNYSFRKFCNRCQILR